MTSRLTNVCLRSCQCRSFNPDFFTARSNQLRGLCISWMRPWPSDRVFNIDSMVITREFSSTCRVSPCFALGTVSWPFRKSTCFHVASYCSLRRIPVCSAISNSGRCSELIAARSCASSWSLNQRMRPLFSFCWRTMRAGLYLIFCAFSASLKTSFINARYLLRVATAQD